MPRRPPGQPPQSRWFVWLLLVLAAVLIVDELEIFASSDEAPASETRVLSDTIVPSTAPSTVVTTTTTTTSLPSLLRPPTTTTTTTKPVTTTTRRTTTTTEPTTTTTTTEDTTTTTVSESPTFPTLPTFIQG